jgi:membrane protein YqaA with SNARE-associated domain
MIGYILLFSSAFLAATILPFYSEIILYALLREGGEPLVLLIVATLGNTLGAVVNWWLGIYLLRFQDRRWFYFSREQITQAQRWFQRYGKWSLLLAWAPIFGDALTLVAGIMRVPFVTFVLLTGTGKCLRYIFVIYLAQLPVL